MAAASLTAAPAAAQDPSTPECYDDHVLARPGLERELRLYCPRTVRASIVEQAPGHEATLLSDAHGDLRLKLASAPGATGVEELVLRLEGHAGTSADLPIRVRTVPLSRNTPPRCDAVEVAERTDGSAAAQLQFNVVCWDDEQDDLTITGAAGPGSHREPSFQSLGVCDDGLHCGGGGSWSYRTAVADGPEQTSYSATDALGARSTDAPISVLVGPAVDRPANCRPNPSGYAQLGRSVVMARPGATRRFGLICEDADGDPVAPRLTAAPLAGDLTRFEVGEPARGWWGLSRWIDAVYVPRAGAPAREVDPFDVDPGGVRGSDTARLGIAVSSPPANAGWGCGGWSATTMGTEPVILKAECTDHEGDALRAKIARPPSHGEAELLGVEPVPYGWDRVEVRYQARSGFTGYDRVVLALSDDFGAERELALEIGVGLAVVPPRSMSPRPWWPGAGLLPGSVPPRVNARKPQATRARSRRQPPAVLPITQARRALRVRDVRLLRRLGPIRAFGARRALAFTCDVRCRIAVTASRSSKARSATARTTRLTVRPGKAAVWRLGRGATSRQRLRAVDATGRSRRATVVVPGAKAQRSRPNR